MVIYLESVDEIVVMKTCDHLNIQIKKSSRVALSFVHVCFPKNLFFKKLFSASILAFVNYERFKGNGKGSRL